LIFRNPWIDTQFIRDNHGNNVPTVVDLLYQRDRGFGPTCYGSVNSGQMYLRNSSLLSTYFQMMRGYKHEIIHDKKELDQVYVGLTSSNLNMTR
jgi:hypothetical protein